MTLLYIVIAVLLIGFLVLVHEVGHYTAARLTGVPVHEFAIGFGKRIISKKKNGILYSLRLIPFGGFVAFADAEDEAGVGNYYKQPVWKRLVTTVSGPLMNFVVAFVVIIAYGMLLGIPEVIPSVGALQPGLPAEKAGLLVGDRILRISGVDIGNDVSLISATINEAKGKPVDILVNRDGTQLSIVLTPEYSEADQRYMIGITPGQAPRRMGFGEAVSFSAVTMVDMVKQLLQFLFGLVTQGKGAGDVASPIGIVSVMTQAAQQYGLKSFIDIAVFLSVNLGLFNLLPLPALDGSKVIFLLIEWVRGKPVPPEKEGVITAVGFGLFILLFIFLAGRDIARLFGWIT
jgi:regulator of sigma E protease